MSFRTNSTKYPTPKELHDKYGFRFYLHHIHNGNDPDQVDRMLFTQSKHPPKYVTYCEILNADNECVGYGEAVCSDKDVPNRKLGHEIAVGRAIKDYMRNKGQFGEKVNDAE